MENQEEILDYLAMSMIPGIGPRIGRRIISHAGSPTSFLNEPEQIRLPGIKAENISSRAIDAFRKEAGKEIRFMKKEGINPLIPADPEYPRRLKSCEDGPLVLFTQGKMDLNAPRMIAVVGTRNATEYGQRATEELIEEMARHGCCLVSGLAYGIDSMAHRAAQSAGIQNVGVLAHGLDRLYPGANKALAAKMKRNGGLVTDFPSGTNPDRENFPARNRIVAGLADAVVVVEAAVTGGALITAGIAMSYNRDVFAVPGRWGDAYSEGCNRIVSNNKAAILSNAADLAWNMGWIESEKADKPIQAQLFAEISPQEETILIQLRKEKSQDIDTLSLALQIPVSKASAMLLELEFKGLVRALPGKIFQVIV